MIALTPEARRHVRALYAYTRNALTAAWEKITTSPGAGLPAPRPYKQLAQPGRVWLKSGRYWIGYRTQPTTAIVAVFFETANIPGRV